MWSWVLSNPHPAAAILAVACGGAVFLGRFVLTRHREFVAFSAHMKREEEEVWPTITKQLSRYHDEAMELLAHHGERIAKLEADGQIGEIHQMLKDLLARRGLGRV